jgi:penicillin-binding protein 1B
MFISGYVYVVVQELKLKLNEAQISKKAVVQSQGKIEGDTNISKSTLDKYLLFSKVKSSRFFYEDNLEVKNFVIEKDNIKTLSEFELPELQLNSCDRYKCIQLRKKFSDIPSSIWKGLLGTEDFRFLDHKGVDPIAIARAIVVDIIAMKFVQGGSTLTQQLVKNLFLTNERKLSRKIKEMIYALYIENILQKEEIINLYLNEVFWGTHQGIYLKGFYAASIAYFNKKPIDLTEFEATILVSFLKGPNYYHPRKGIDRIKQRARAVYNRLSGLKLVTNKQSSIWADKQWVDWQESFMQRNEKAYFNSYYKLSKNSETYLDAFDKFVLFESVNNVVEYLKPRLKDADIGIKIIVADKECKSFDCNKLFSFYSKLERDKRVAMVEELHQVGSLLKPIVYESFVELGRSYDEKISTKPITLKLKSGNWTPKDYSKVKVDEILLKDALQKSKNIPLVRIASEIGFDILEQNLETKFPRLLKPLSQYPAQLLGAMELSLSEVLGVYSGFIDQKCKDLEDKELSFEESVLFYMSVASETTISKLARAPLKNAYVFGKTGTTNNGLDNWYFAFDGKRVYVIWFGVESQRDKYDLRLSGAVSSYLIFQNFMNSRGKQISEVVCTNQ